MAIVPPINTARPPITKGIVMKLSAWFPVTIKVNPTIITTTKDAIDAWFPIEAKVLAPAFYLLCGDSIRLRIFRNPVEFTQIQEEKNLQIMNL